MTSSILIQVIITCLLGASSPGPSLVLVSRNAIANGKFSGAITGFGHGLGIFIYAFITILGLGIISNINPKFIDYITLFNEDTPEKLIREIRPDILVKGDDYKIDEVVGREIVEGYGAHVELIPIVKGHSTTMTLEKIIANHRSSDESNGK